jgi:myosin-3
MHSISTLKKINSYCNWPRQQEQEEEEIPIERFHFYDNKQAVDQLMAKDDGLFFILDETSRQLQDTSYVFNRLSGRKCENVHVKIEGQHEFSVAHYTGKLQYDANEIAEKNRDFVPPEMIETLRLSSEGTVRELFVNKLTKAGALTIHSQDTPKENEKQERKKTARSKWGAALLQSEQVTNLRVRLLKLSLSLSLSLSLGFKAEGSQGLNLGEPRDSSFPGH